MPTIKSSYKDLNHRQTCNDHISMIQWSSSQCTIPYGQSTTSNAQTQHLQFSMHYELHYNRSTKKVSISHVICSVETWMKFNKFNRQLFFWEITHFFPLNRQRSTRLRCHAARYPLDIRAIPNIFLGNIRHSDCHIRYTNASKGITSDPFQPTSHGDISATMSR